MWADFWTMLVFQKLSFYPVVFFMLLSLEQSHVQPGQIRYSIGESNIFIFHWTMFDGETLNYNNFSTQSSLRWHTMGTTNSPGLRTPAGILEVAYQL